MGDFKKVEKNHISHWNFFTFLTLVIPSVLIILANGKVDPLSVVILILAPVILTVNLLRTWQQKIDCNGSEKTIEVGLGPWRLRKGLVGPLATNSLRFETSELESYAVRTLTDDAKMYGLCCIMPGFGGGIGVRPLPCSKHSKTVPPKTGVAKRAVTISGGFAPWLCCELETGCCNCITLHPEKERLDEFSVVELRIKEKKPLSVCPCLGSADVIRVVTSDGKGFGKWLDENTNAKCDESGATTGGLASTTNSGGNNNNP